jgi:hypothetical protein
MNQLKALRQKLAGAPTPPAITRTPHSEKAVLARKASSREAPRVAPPLVREVLSSPGKPLAPPMRASFESRFGWDFSRVRIHDDAHASESARQVNAQAYTVGQNIVFAEGHYAPSSAQGAQLLAHELAHAVQQGEAVPNGEVRVGERDTRQENEAESAAQHNSSVQPSEEQLLLQRQPDDLSTRSASQIMADERYIDNHLKSIQFFEAQLAVLRYDDGSELRLGLTPDWIKPPIDGVDYRSLREQHIPIVSGEPGKLQYIPRGAETLKQMPDDTKANIGQALLQFTRTVTFRRDPASHRIVPTEVNSITAPHLCAVLREAEAEYVKNVNAMAAGGKKVFEKLKTIVELLAFTEGGAAAGEGTGVRAASKVGTVAAADAESTLVRKFAELLVKKTSGEITVGGVAFSDVQVALEGTELAVRRTFIVNVGRVPGQGKAMQAVWEAAAVKAAQAAGAKSVQIALRTVTNVTWKAYLESQGYTWQSLPKLFGVFGEEGAMVKTVAL